ncbi:MAG: hypothetical protein HKM87_01410 [Ignavibacteriaceae bacterium]|nr:hypothetical protein [Ignavibacteriaceae bacterium]
MNNKQKTTLIIGLVLIASALVVWLAHGAEIFTKTQVLVEKYDELFGYTYEEWVDKIIIGLDYAGSFSAVVALITGILLFIFKDKKKEKQV